MIAQAALGGSPEALARAARLPLAESALSAPAASFGGEEFYVDFPTKVAVLCARLIKNHPLPDGNKRVAYLCAVEFAERNGWGWEAPAADDPGGDETVRTLKAVAAGELSEARFARWVAERVKGGGPVA